MINLSVNITEKEKSYPIYINNIDINNLKSAILNEIADKNYIVVFSQKVHKLYGKILDFPKEKTFIRKHGTNKASSLFLQKW